MSFATLGIDISKDTLDVALYQDDSYRLATFTNEKDGYRRLAKWLKKHKARECRVCIEATSRYGETVAMYLYERDYSVSVVNPARIKAYGASMLKRNKTDREDAKVIAHFCATQNPGVWAPPPPEIQELQALTRRLEALKADRTRELNRKQSGVQSKTVLADIDAHIDFLKKQIAIIEQRIRDLLDQHPDLREQHDLLTSIPGIGDITAARLIAEIPDVNDFQSANQLAAYAGLTPRNHNSGSSVHRRGRLVKTGNKRFRTALFLPALAAMRFNPIVQALVERMQTNGKNRMTIVGAVMRKLVHLAYGVLKHRKPFDPDYLVNVQVSA
jgi:transposase